MLSLDDDRWVNFTGGYRVQCDPRPLLAKLEDGLDTEATWHELWHDLHHQGDVGEASFAAVPHLVRIYRKHITPDWNTYAMVAVIELAREKGNNPAVPRWLEEDYFPFGPSLEWLRSDAITVQLLWALPITPAEAEFVKQNGIEELEQRFDAAKLHYWDTQRHSVV